MGVRKRTISYTWSSPPLDRKLTDRFVCLKRALLAQITPNHEVAAQIDMVYALIHHRIKKRVPRGRITSFKQLLDEARTGELTLTDNDAKAPPQESSGAKKKSRCSFCNYKGHDISECQKKLKSPANVPKTPPPKETGLRCYGCGKPGIMRRDFPDCNVTPRVRVPPSVSFCTMSAETKPRSRPALYISAFDIHDIAFVDTGARTSVGNYELEQILKKRQHPLRAVNIYVTLADVEQKRQAVRVTTLPLKIQGKEVQATMVFFPNSPSTKTLLGVVMIEDAGIVINARAKYWHFGDRPSERIAFINKKAESTSMDAVDTVIPRPVTPTDKEVSAILNEYRLPPLNLPQDPAETTLDSAGPPERGSLFLQS